MLIKKYQICTKTVMDTTDPSTKFDCDGVSNHYWDFTNNVLPNWHPDEYGSKKLEAQIDNIKNTGRGKEFDCILGLSGGLDSSYMLHTVVTKYGLRPLVFHVDGGWNSELAVNNIQQMVEKLNVDLFTEVIDWAEMRDFQLAWFKSGLPNIDVPQDHAFIAVLYKFAEKHGIKTILNGGNIATESVSMPYQYYYWGTDLSQVNDVIKRFCSQTLRSYPFSSTYRHKIYLRFFKGMKVFKPLNFMPYLQKDAVKVLEENYGWKSYKQKHFESRFTKFYESYWLPTRFGFDVRRNQFSSLILSGQMTRENALKLLENSPYDENDIENDLNYIATKLRISTDELIHYRDMPKKFHWDYRNQSAILSSIDKLVTGLKIARRGGAF